MRSFEKQSKPKDDIRMSFIEHSQSIPELILTLPGTQKLDALLFHEHFPQTPIIGLENKKADFNKLIKESIALEDFLIENKYQQFLNITLDVAMPKATALLSKADLNEDTKLAILLNAVEVSSIYNLLVLEYNRAVSSEDLKIPVNETILQLLTKPEPESTYKRPDRHFMDDLVI